MFQVTKDYFDNERETYIGRMQQVSKNHYLLIDDNDNVFESETAFKYYGEEKSFCYGTLFVRNEKTHETYTRFLFKSTKNLQCIMNKIMILEFKSDAFGTNLILTTQLEETNEKNHELDDKLMTLVKKYNIVKDKINNLKPSLINLKDLKILLKEKENYEQEITNMKDIIYTIHKSKTVYTIHSSQKQEVRIGDCIVLFMPSQSQKIVANKEIEETQSKRKYEHYLLNE